MRRSDFDYSLPKECIAQTPAPGRDQSRLMILPRNAGEILHGKFSDFPKLLKHTDLVVMNNTQVIPARLRGTKATGGKVEILLDRPLGESLQKEGFCCQQWTCLMHASKPLKEGAKVILPGGGIAVYGGRVGGFGVSRLQIQFPCAPLEYLKRYGEVPLPGYIKRKDRGDLLTEDRKRYQTVYAQVPGSVAAPTAGLHFTVELLDQIRSMGIATSFVTLHVGPGTFLPVRCENIDEHVMHHEIFHIGEEAASAVERTKREGGRIVAVGTTVVRTLETAWKGGRLTRGQGESNLFIRPGHQFQVIDALLTNFHLPSSTLLMLVCAFSDTRRVLSAYQQAVDKGYRFYSYGDAMFLC